MYAHVGKLPPFQDTNTKIGSNMRFAFKHLFITIKLYVVFICVLCVYSKK